MTVKIRKISEKISLKCHNLTLSWVSNRVIYKLFTNTSEITKFEKVLNVRKVYKQEFVLNKILAARILFTQAINVL